MRNRLRVQAFWPREWPVQAAVSNRSGSLHNVTFAKKQGARHRDVGA